MLVSHLKTSSMKFPDSWSTTEPGVTSYQTPPLLRLPQSDQEFGTLSSLDESLLSVSKLCGCETKARTDTKYDYDCSKKKIGIKKSKKGEKSTRKQKYAFQTRSAVDILDDGHLWRKYGQKAVKNNMFPRSDTSFSSVLYLLIGKK